MANPPNRYPDYNSQHSLYPNLYPNSNSTVRGTVVTNQGQPSPVIHVVQTIQQIQPVASLTGNAPHPGGFHLLPVHQTQPPQVVRVVQGPPVPFFSPIPSSPTRLVPTSDGRHIIHVASNQHLAGNPVHSINTTPSRTTVSYSYASLNPSTRQNFQELRKH
jgi:hypothetical protein